MTATLFAVENSLQIKNDNQKNINLK